MEVYVVATSWRAHDRYRFSRLTVEKILNHAERDVTAVYDRHSYDPEKRTALEAWGRRLEQILNPDSHGVPRTHATSRGAAGQGAAVQ